MSSKKCPTCGLTNFGSAVLCKRCHQSLRKVQATSAEPRETASTSVGAAKNNARSTPVNPVNDTEQQAQRKRIGKIIGGVLIGVGLIFGLATALTQDYNYLAVAGPALLVGAFVTVLLSREVNRVPSTYVWLKAFQVGIAFTVLGGLFIYSDGLFTLKSFVPILGVGLLVIGGVSYRRAKAAAA